MKWKTRPFSWVHISITYSLYSHLATSGAFGCHRSLSLDLTPGTNPTTQGPGGKLEILPSNIYIWQLYSILCNFHRQQLIFQSIGIGGTHVR